MDQTIEIFIDQLVTDEEFRHMFLRHPRRTLRMAGDWGLPLSDREISALLAIEPALWDRVAEALIDRLRGGADALAAA